MNAVGNSSFELDRNRWERLRRRSTSNQGLSAATELKVPFVLSLRFKDIASIHEHRQGKVTLSFLSKEQCRTSATVRISTESAAHSRLNAEFLENFFFDENNS